MLPSKQVIYNSLYNLGTSEPIHNTLYVYQMHFRGRLGLLLGFDRGR
jgi:hypothetical protein